MLGAPAGGAGESGITAGSPLSGTIYQAANAFSFRGGSVASCYGSRPPNKEGLAWFMAPIIS